MKHLHSLILALNITALILLISVVSTARMEHAEFMSAYSEREELKVQLFNSFNMELKRITGLEGPSSVFTAPSPCDGEVKPVGGKGSGIATAPQMVSFLSDWN